MAEVEYKYRRCGANSVCEVYVESVRFLDPTLCDCPGDDAVKDALTELVVGRSLPQSCYPDDGECTDALRMVVGGCYELVYSGGPGEPVPDQWISCGADICCIGDYEICVDENSDVSFTMTSQNQPILPCQALPHGDPPDPETCYQFCGALPNIYQPPASKTRLLPGGEMSKLSVLPNPSGDEFRVECASDSVAHATLYLYDIEGKVVTEVQLNRAGSSGLTGTVDVGDVSAGTYQCVVRSAQHGPLCSGAMIVSR